MQKYCSFTDKSFFSIHLRQPGSVGRARHTFPAPKCIISKGMRLLTVNRKTYSSNVGKWEMVRALTVTYKRFCLHVCKLIKLCRKENSMHHSYFCCCVQGTLDYSIASQLHFVNCSSHMKPGLFAQEVVHRVKNRGMRVVLHHAHCTCVCLTCFVHCMSN